MFPLIYPIIDAGVCARRGADPTALAAACLRGGARLLQLRVKEGPGRAFLALAEALVALAATHEARIIVNDRADVARIARAAGVHLGQDDLPVAAARAILGAEAIVGVSTHDPRQVDDAAADAASYIAVGPVFGTSTKDTGYSARGLDLVRHAAATGKPVIAIGGITLDNGRSVLDAGASSLAVISDLLAAGDPEARTRAFLALQVPAPRSTPQHL